MLVLAIVALLVPLGVSLRDRVDSEVRLQARSEAQVVAARAAPLVSGGESAALDSLTTRAARAVRGRVLVVGRDGRLLADSSPAGLSGASYASRPEIAAALRGEVTQERRQSNTLGTELLATAVPVIEDGRTRGAVRVTQGVTSVNRAVRRSWVGLGAIGGLVLVLGLVAGALIARRIARPILRLEDAARSVAAGDLSARACVEGSTEQRALARTFNSMTERLSTLLAAQRDFVADASHQLRTPLSGMRLRLEEARADAVDQRQRADLDAALVETDRLAEIVTGLLELSRAGEDAGPAATADPADAARRAIERFAGPADAAGCRLRLVVGNVEPVVGHPADLDRILDVLLENALAYAPGTDVVVDVGGPELSVRDHGRGVQPSEAETVFERFHRGSAGLSGPPGTGLGLAIARDLARRWGGEVTLEPCPDGGTLARARFVPAAS